MQKDKTLTDDQRQKKAKQIKNGHAQASVERLDTRAAQDMGRLRLVRDAKPKPTQILSNFSHSIAQDSVSRTIFPPPDAIGRAEISSRRIPLLRSAGHSDRGKIRQELARRKIFRLDANNSASACKYPYSAKRTRAECALVRVRGSLSGGRDNKLSTISLPAQFPTRAISPAKRTAKADTVAARGGDILHGVGRHLRYRRHHPCAGYGLGILLLLLTPLVWSLPTTYMIGELSAALSRRKADSMHGCDGDLEISGISRGVALLGCQHLLTWQSIPRCSSPIFPG